MKFPKQIFAEITKMLRSKFIIISAVLIFLFITVATPLFTFITGRDGNNNMYYYGYDNGGIIVDGVEYDLNNQMTWELDYLRNNAEYLAQNLSGQPLIYAQDMSDRLIDFYEKYIPYVQGDGYENEDYRLRLSYEMSSNVATLYVLQLQDATIEDLKTAIEGGIYVDLNLEEIFEMTDIEKADEIARLEEALANFDGLMVDNDFSKYVDIMKIQYAADIQSNLDRIETLEADIIKDPSQEEYMSDEIDRLLADNLSIEQTQIPELDYRLEHNIIYNDGTWQDEALSSKTSSQRQILESDLYKMTEEQFYEDQWNVDRYGTYQAYEESIEKSLQEAEFDLFVAESSLNSNKPDMEFVEDGSRQGSYEIFNFSMIIMMFGVLIGGWVIASEFQSGTVRLLMIRPRTRLKVMFSKFIAGMALIYVLYFAVFIISLLTQGFTKGFSDFMYPNYTASGEINFFIMFIGHFFAISTAFVFIYTLGFAASVIIRNIAVAIILPIIIMFGSTILMAFLTSRPPFDLIAFTPLPYMNMQEFFGESYTITNQLIEKGVPLSIELGMVVLLVYSAILVAVAAAVFKKHDITN